MKKGDILILAAVLILAITFFLVTGRQQLGEYVHITANGKTTTYPLNKNRSVKFKRGKDGQNTVIIKDMEVYMESASCPDKICVRHKAVSKNGESIICLPNEVFIEIESKTQKETDN